MDSMVALLRDQTQLLADGVRVPLSSNEVHLSVVRGRAGCTLWVNVCGMQVGVPLVDAAAAHLAAQLMPPGGAPDEQAAA